MKPHDASQLFGIPVVALGLLVLYAGISKLLYQRDFRRSLLFVPHLPMYMVPATAIVVPLAEIAGGAGLILGSAFGSVLTLVLLIATSMVALIAIRVRQQVPCVCFTSSGSSHLSMATVIRNGIFACVAAAPLIVPVSNDSILVWACALALIFLYLSIDAAIKNLATLNSWRPT